MTASQPAARPYVHTLLPMAAALVLANMKAIFRCGFVMSVVVLPASCVDRDSSLTPFSPAEADIATMASAAHTTTADGFSFLPPLVMGTAVSGPLLAELLPFLSVEVCRRAADECAGTVVRFTHRDERSERLRIGDGTSGHFHVNLHTADYDFAEDEPYLLRVLVGPYELGSVELTLSGRSGGKDIAGTGARIRKGATIPIRFRVTTASIFGSIPATVALGDPEPAPGLPVPLLGTPPSGRLQLLVEGEWAAVVSTSAGPLAAMPLFLDPETLWPAPPAGPLDLMMFRDGAPVAWSLDAVLMGTLEDAPGTSDALVRDARRIAHAFSALPPPALHGPGRQEQWMLATVAGLEQLADDVGRISSDQPTRRLTDALLASTGVAEAMERFANDAGSLATPAEATSHRAASAAVANAPRVSAGNGYGVSFSSVPLPPTDPILIDDNLVGDLFVAYDEVKLFGETVIHETAQTWESVKLAATFLGASKAPGLDEIGAILGAMDYLINRIVVGVLPSEIQHLNLRLLDTELRPGEFTAATVTLVARNEPTAILTVEDIVKSVLGSVGEMAGDQFQSFTQVTKSVAEGAIGVIKKKLVEYGATHPDLDLGAGITLPLITWESEIQDPALVDRRTHTPDVIQPLPAQVNWVASNHNFGEGRIYAVTATGAFGERAAASNEVQVEVWGELVLAVGFAAVIEEAGINALEARSGYLNAADDTIWWPGINIGLLIDGGTLAESSGATDAAGQFVTLVQHTPGSDSVIVSVTARGARSQAVTRDVVARVPASGFDGIYTGPIVDFDGPCGTDPWVVGTGWTKVDIEGDQITLTTSDVWGYNEDGWHVLRYEGLLEESGAFRATRVAAGVWGRELPSELSFSVLAGHFAENPRRIIATRYSDSCPDDLLEMTHESEVAPVDLTGVWSGYPWPDQYPYSIMHSGNLLSGSFNFETSWYGVINGQVMGGRVIGLSFYNQFSRRYENFVGMIIGENEIVLRTDGTGPTMRRR